MTLKTSPKFDFFDPAELADDFSPETMEEAMAFLGSLSQALFPDGAPTADLLTWADRLSSKEMTADGRGEGIEERLRKAEARFKALVEQIPAVTFMAVLGEGENEIYVSPHIEQMLGFSQEEWLSDPFLWYNQLHPDDRGLWNEEFGRGCRTGGPFRAECRFIARNGNVVWVHGEARLVKDALGRPQFLQGVAFDITESKRAQEVLLEHAVTSARAEEELAIARRVQTMILPTNPKVKGLTLATNMIPADEVGGDYFDVLPTDDGAWIAIGDVSGHGLNAGLVMLMVQSAASSIIRARKIAPPRIVLSVLNDVICENVDTRLSRKEYVTLTLMKYTTDGTVVYSGAHQDILVYRRTKNEVRRIKTPGIWVGIRSQAPERFIDSRLKLEPGDLMLLFTDGIIESMNDRGEQYDIDRLSQCLMDHADEEPAVIRDAIFRDVLEWARFQVDDRTVLVARYDGPSSRDQDGRQ